MKFPSASLKLSSNLNELINSGITLTDKEAERVEAYIQHHQQLVSNRYYENARATAAIRTGVPS